ncbi:MAG: BsaWI family type II restriction enzyme [Candidatus Bathyarchaeia archaeon]
MNPETASERQSRVSKTGRKWEDYVQQWLQERLKRTDITVVRGDTIPEGSLLWKKLSIPTKVSVVQESVWGDIDLVAMRGEILVAVISCKLSLHGRFTESLFYSLLYRMWSRTKFVLVTPDAGRAQKGGKWSSEWGRPEHPTKDRTLAESYMDGVYVENAAEFCKGKKPNEQTCLGGIIRPLSELPEDLVKWGEENSKFTFAARTS